MLLSSPRDRKELSAAVTSPSPATKGGGRDVAADATSASASSALSSGLEHARISSGATRAHPSAVSSASRARATPRAASSARATRGESEGARGTGPGPAPSAPSARGFAFSSRAVSASVSRSARNARRVRRSTTHPPLTTSTRSGCVTVCLFSASFSVANAEEASFSSASKLTTAPARCVLARFGSSDTAGNVARTSPATTTTASDPQP